MVKYLGQNIAVDFANAHETEEGSKASHIMDLHNNEVGRNVASQYPSASDDQLLKLLTEGKFMYLESGSQIPSGSSFVMIYFEGKRQYDGSLLGSMTNPDNKITWNVMFDINQCGDILRGQYLLNSGAYYQKRRFTGTVKSNNFIVLNVEEPYLFESPPDSKPCVNVVISLKGNEISLTGSWTSTSCKLGGEIKVAK